MPAVPRLKEEGKGSPAGTPSEVVQQVQCLFKLQIQCAPNGISKRFLPVKSAMFYIRNHLGHS